jgi:hypothetical protein
LFDHGWVEQFYLAAIERAQRDIDHFQQQASGYGEAHRETRRRAEMLAAWAPRFIDAGFLAPPREL